MTIFAAQDYQPGDVIMTSVPIGHILSPELRGKNCDYCLQPSSNLRSCQKCHYFSYCSPSCETEDWEKFHQYECPLYGGTHLLTAITKLDSEDIKFLQVILRIYLRVKANPQLGEEQLPLPDETTRSYSDMMTHLEDYYQDKNRTRYFAVMSSLLSPFLPDLDVEFLRAVYLKFVINAFGIIDNYINVVGDGQYVEASICNHSCRPNTSPIFESFRMEIRAMTTIKKGEEIFISYDADLTKPQKDRRKDLRERYYFDCCCQRCQEEEKPYDRSSNNLNSKEPIGDASKNFKLLLDSMQSSLQEEEWKGVYQTGKQLLVLIEKVLGPYHPTITLTLRYMWTAVQMRGSVVKNKKEGKELFNRLKRHAEVTHGKEHSFYRDAVIG